MLGQGRVGSIAQKVSFLGLPPVAMESSMSTSEPMAVERFRLMLGAGGGQRENRRHSRGEGGRTGQDERMFGVCLHHNTEAQQHEGTVMADTDAGFEGKKKI